MPVPFLPQTFSNDTITVVITDSTDPALDDLKNLIFALARDSLSIPTLSQWGMALLGLLLFVMSIMVMRRRRMPG